MTMKEDDRASVNIPTSAQCMLRFLSLPSLFLSSSAQSAIEQYLREGSDSELRKSAHVLGRGDYQGVHSPSQVESTIRCGFVKRTPVVPALKAMRVHRLYLSPSFPRVGFSQRHQSAQSRPLFKVEPGRTVHRLHRSGASRFLCFCLLERDGSQNYDNRFNHTFNFPA